MEMQMTVKCLHQALSIINTVPLLDRSLSSPAPLAAGLMAEGQNAFQGAGRPNVVGLSSHMLLFIFC